MDKIRKNITSIVIFIINLILMGVGFLFIKNSEEAKNKDNLTNENTDAEEQAKNEEMADPVTTTQEEVTSSTKNIPAATVPVNPVPKATKNSSAKTKTS